MATQDFVDLQAAVAAVKASADAVVTKYQALVAATQTLQDTVTSLTNQLAQQPQPADLQALTATLNSAKAELDALP